MAKNILYRLYNTIYFTVLFINLNYIKINMA